MVRGDSTPVVVVLVCTLITMSGRESVSAQGVSIHVPGTYGVYGINTHVYCVSGSERPDSLDLGVLESSP